MRFQPFSAPTKYDMLIVKTAANGTALNAALFGSSSTSFVQEVLYGVQLSPDGAYVYAIGRQTGTYHILTKPLAQDTSSQPAITSYPTINDHHPRKVRRHTQPLLPRPSQLLRGRILMST